ncbi:MAG: SprT-like domain-containing protein [Pseudomonadota bacterium]
MTETQLQAAVAARIQELCTTFSIRPPSVSLDLTGATAGQALWPANHIRLNQVLLRENLAAFLAEVIPHELCHLWQRQLGKTDRPHGRVWQALMRRMGVEPRRCHRFDLASARTRCLRHFAYACACGPQSLSSRRHNKVQRGEALYRCRRCGQTLVRAP